MLLEKEGKNLVLDHGKISDLSKKVIAGILDLADALTAFGNTIPTSYLRLVPHQEAPTNICWGARNRSALVRVPLGWTGHIAMAATANPVNPPEVPPTGSRQTFEFRVPDGSADIHLTIAGLIVAAEHGLEMKGALEMAEELYIEGSLYGHPKARKLEQLPASCVESATRLEAKRPLFEARGVFPARLIDYTLKHLRSFNDEHLRAELSGNEEATRELVRKFIHCQ